MSGAVKRGEDIVLGKWKDLIPESPEQETPKGYSTAEEIAGKLCISITAARHKLKQLRISNKIECLQVRGTQGNPTWVYKD